MTINILIFIMLLIIIYLNFKKYSRFTDYKDNNYSISWVKDGKWYKNNWNIFRYNPKYELCRRKIDEKINNIIKVN